MIKSILSKISFLKNTLCKKLIKKSKKKWENFEFFSEDWKERIKIMSLLIQKEEKTIIDLWCWKMWLKEYLEKDKKYIWCDYTDRWWNLICDFNKKEFPDLIVDTSFISWCLEYIIDYQRFIDQVCAHSNSVVISYCSTDFNKKISQRNINLWKNHLSNSDLIQSFSKNWFILDKFFINYNWNVIFRFYKK